MSNTDVSLFEKLPDAPDLIETDPNEDEKELEMAEDNACIAKLKAKNYIVIPPESEPPESEGGKRRKKRKTRRRRKSKKSRKSRRRKGKKSRKSRRRRRRRTRKKK